MAELHTVGMGSRQRAGLTALVLVALVGCSDAERRKPPSRVQAELPRLERFEQTLDTVSTMEATNEVDLASQAGGRVQQVLVRQGQAVQKGQLLVVLDQTQLQADVIALRAQATRDQLNYERFRNLVAQGAATPQQRDEYRASAVGSREALRAKLADLAYKDVRAPISGVIGDLSIKPGEVISAGTSFSRITRNNPLLARIDVPSNRIGQLRPGQTVQLLGARGAKPVAQGQIAMIDPDISATSQTLLAKASIANPRGLLRNGQRLRTRVLLGSEEHLAVPFAAVNRQFGQSFVFVVGTLEQLRRDPGRADLAALKRLPPNTPLALQRPVQLGPLQGDVYPVISGLQPGDRVIVSGAQGLRHGSPVTLVR